MIWLYCVMSALGGAFVTGFFWLLEATKLGDPTHADDAGWVTMIVSAVLALITLAIAGWLR